MIDVLIGFFVMPVLGILGAMAFYLGTVIVPVMVFMLLGSLLSRLVYHFRE